MFQRLFGSCAVKLFQNFSVVFRRRFVAAKQCLPSSLLRVPASQQWYTRLLALAVERRRIHREEVAISHDRKAPDTRPPTFAGRLENLFGGHRTQRGNRLPSEARRERASRFLAFRKGDCRERARDRAAFADGARNQISRQ